MRDLVTGAGVHVELTVPMPPERVYDLVSDVRNHGRYSPECVWADWISAEQGTVGARFAARNVYPDGFSTEVYCQVTEARRPTVFGWMVLDPQDDPARPGSLWRYELTPDGAGGTTVRQTFTHGPGWTGTRAGAEQHPTFLTRRLENMRANMIATLTALVAGQPARPEESR